MTLRIGQTLYRLKVNNAARGGGVQQLTPVVVKSIGKKYFVCGVLESEFWNVQYRLEDWSENTTYAPDSKLYASPQEWEDEKESYQLWMELKRLFQYNNAFSLDTLRQIKELTKK